MSGLTTAICLREAGYDVSVRAAEPPRDTTSRVAGALWGATFGGPADKVGRWAEESLSAFRELAGDPATGVTMATGMLASTTGVAPPPEMFPSIEIRPAEPPPGVERAFRITVPVIDMNRYLDHLVERLGVEIELGRVDSLEQAPLVVNCTGMGAHELVPDSSLKPVRGQHVVVENPGIEEFFMTEPFPPSWASFFPHGDRVVCGGVAQADDWELEPREEDARLVIENCARWEPRLREARVIEHMVGLRPARDDVRVERERSGDTVVVHNYGHGGAGVALSWGCAREVVALLAGAPEAPARKKDP